MSQNYQRIKRELSDAILDNNYDMHTKEDVAERYLRSLHIYGVRNRINLRDGIRNIITPHDWEIFPVVRIAFLRVFSMDIVKNDSDVGRYDEYIHDPQIIDRPNGPQRPGAGEVGQSDYHASLIPHETSERPGGPENTYDKDHRGMRMVKKHKPVVRSLYSMVEDLSTAVRNLETHVSVVTTQRSQTQHQPH